MLVGVDDKKYILYYDCGDFTLNQFTEERREKSIMISERIPEFKYIIAKLYDICSQLNKKKVFHSDWKPENIILKKEGLL